MLIEEVMPSLESEHIADLKVFQDFPKGGRSEKNCSEAVAELAKELDNKKEQLKNSTRTARLWIQFLEYVDVMKLFIRAERLGGWEIHLTDTKRTLKLFAATGYSNNAKSVRIYLQQMLKFPEKHPGLHTVFKENGYHSVRRSDRHWAGLWSDLIIEQVMMKSIKSRLGLTRGRSFTKSTRHQWVHTARQCAVIYEAMPSVTKATLANSEKHVELGVSRKNRDISDLSKIKAWFREHNPFEGGPELRSLSTGICNDGTVICDNSEKTGKEIQKRLDNVYLHDASVTRRLKVRNIESLYNSVKISDKKFVVIKPTALFLRLIAIAQRENKIERFFSYELMQKKMD